MSQPKTVFGLNLKRELDQRGFSMRAFGMSIGLSESAIKHMVHGNSKSPRHENAAAAADALGVSLDYLMGKQGDIKEPSTLNQRFAVTRWACWGDNKANACSEHWLDIQIAQLDAIESGEEKPSLSLLVRFSEKTGVPMSWFLSAKWTGLPGEIGARVASARPHWAPDYPAAEAGSQRGVGLSEKGGQGDA